jgi:hypothetical protein
MSTRFVFGDHEKFRRRGKTWSVLSGVFLLGCFAVAALETTLVWIFAGTSAYALVMSIYNFVLSAQARYPYRKTPLTQQQRDIDAHIRFHLPILLSLLLGGALAAIIIWVFVATR